MKQVVILILVMLVVLIGLGVWFKNNEIFKDTGVPSPPLPLMIPTPTPYLFSIYQVPVVQVDEDYGIFFVGDSMTEALGPHPSIFSQRINAEYPEKDFVIDNYSQGSRNVLSLLELLSEPLDLDGLAVEAAHDREFDVLVIESFGQNPLSHLPLEEGLKQQEEMLDLVMTQITRDHPRAVVIFLATIAPSREKFGDGLLNLPDELKAGYVRERRLYIENHVSYAREHQIPLLNLYTESQNGDGTVKLNYLRPDDFIHPSSEAVVWIQNRLADFIIENEYLPH